MKPHGICLSVTSYFHSIISSKFIHVVPGVRISFHCKAEKHAIVCVYIYIYTQNHILIIHSAINRYSGCLSFWLVQIVLLWVWVCTYLSEFLLSSFEGWTGNSIFNFLSNYHVVLHSGYTIYKTTIKAQAFQFSHKLTNSWFLFFDYSHSNRYEVLSHCGFDVHCY